MSNEKRVIATSLAQLKGIAEGAAKASVTFTQKIKALNAEVTKKRGEIAANIELAGPERKAKAEAHYTAEFNDWIRDYRKSTENERYSTLKELNAANEQVAYARQNLTDPRRLATAHGLGTEVRSRLESSLATMGIASLASLAAKAKAEKDTDLGAALIQVNDGLPRNERPFQSSEMAEHLWGHAARAAKDFVTTVERSLASAMVQNREFDGFKQSPFSKLAAGMKFEGTLVPKEMSAPAPVRKTSIERISEGLADL